MQNTRVYLPNDVRMHLKYAFHTTLAPTPPHITIAGLFDLDPLLVTYHGQEVLEAVPDENDAIHVIQPHLGFHAMTAKFHPTQWYISGIDSRLQLDLDLAFDVHELTSSTIKVNFRRISLMLRDRSGDRLFNTNDHSEIYEYRRLDGTMKGFDIVKEYDFYYNVRFH